MTDQSAGGTTLVEGMRDAIISFQASRVPLDRLTRDLKSRIAALRGVADDDWVDELKAMWNQLEVVNAFFIESGRDSLTPEERQEVDDVLGELTATLVRY